MKFKYLKYGYSLSSSMLKACAASGSVGRWKAIPGRSRGTSSNSWSGSARRGRAPSAWPPCAGRAVSPARAARAPRRGRLRAAPCSARRAAGRPPRRPARSCASRARRYAAGSSRCGRLARGRPGRERLQGAVKVDGAYAGGAGQGVFGRESADKHLVAVAAEPEGNGAGASASGTRRTPRGRAWRVSQRTASSRAASRIRTVGAAIAASSGAGTRNLDLVFCNQPVLYLARCRHSDQVFSKAIEMLISTTGSEFRLERPYQPPLLCGRWLVEIRAIGRTEAPGRGTAPRLVDDRCRPHAYP